MSEGTLNLTPARSEKSVLDKPSFGSTLSTYDQERWMAAACGTTLAMFGSRRGGFGGGLLASLGTVLAVRAAMGRRDVGVARDFIDRQLKENGWRRSDMVSEASEQSFPASDSPSWTPGGTTQP
jgi:uncharacterized membrane protein